LAEYKDIVDLFRKKGQSKTSFLCLFFTSGVISGILKLFFGSINDHMALLGVLKDAKNRCILCSSSIEKANIGSMCNSCKDRLFRPAPGLTR